MELNTIFNNKTEKLDEKNKWFRISSGKIMQLATLFGLYPPIYGAISHKILRIIRMKVADILFHWNLCVLNRTNGYEITSLNCLNEYNFSNQNDSSNGPSLQSSSEFKSMRFSNTVDVSLNSHSNDSSSTLIGSRVLMAISPDIDEIMPIPRKRRQIGDSPSMLSVSADKTCEENVCSEVEHTLSEIPVTNQLSDSVPENVSDSQSLTGYGNIYLPPRIRALCTFFYKGKPAAQSWKNQFLNDNTIKSRWNSEDLQWAKKMVKIWSCDNDNHKRSPHLANPNVYVKKQRNENKCAILQHSACSENQSGKSESIRSDTSLRPSSAYLRYANITTNSNDHSISLRHKIYQSERHGSTVDPILTTSKITPEAQEILLVLRDTVESVVNDIVVVDEKVSLRDFSPCILMVKHLLLIPSMMIALMDHLHYTPQEFELVSVAQNLTTLINDVSNDPVVILFRMVELGHYLHYLGRVLGENIVPKDMPRLLHSIQVKIQRLKIGRVVRQYYYIPVSYDFIITPYNKDRQLVKLEEECRCLVNLLHPDDPRSQYCPPGYRTIEVIYDDEGGKFETFLHRLNRILSPRRYKARLVTTILRQFNGEELAMTAEHAADLLNTDHRPRYNDIRALVVTGHRPIRTRHF